MTKFDYVVIGAGQGASLARMLAEGGKRVALVEKRFVGGTCTNVGCTPTKAHIACAKGAHTVRTSHQLGVKAHLEGIDMRAIVARTRRIVEEFRQENEERLLKTAGLELFYGVGRFSKFGDVEVKLRDGGVESLEADKYIVAVGAKSQLPEIEGLAEVPFLTHSEALQLEEVPSRLLILGGGYMACEFAQMFARFGSHVTLVQNKSQILPREDRDVAEGVADILRGSGVEIVVDQEVQSVRRTGLGLTAVWGQEERVFSHVLLATGQTPQTDDLDLHFADVKVDKSRYIVTDDYLKSSNPRIYALGDCRVGPAFTHAAYDDARILRDGLLHSQWRSVNDRLMPYVVFIDPQLGRVGLSESEAKKAGKKFDIARLAMKDTARGVETEQDQGFWKVLVEHSTGLILGGALLSGEGGETMAVIEVAMKARMPYTTLRDGIFAHPTWAESLNNLFLRLDEKPKK